MPECNQIITIPQYTGTCWFNSLMMSLFYSEGMRKLLVPRIEKWVKVNSAKKIIQDIVMKYHVNADEKHIDFFNKFRPEVLLQELHKEDSFIFTFNPDVREGYNAYRYYAQMLNYLDIKNFHLLDAYRNVNVSSIKYDLFHTIHNTKKSKNPDVIVISTESSFDKKIQYTKRLDQSLFTQNTIGFNKEIIYNDHTYVADSLVLANFNVLACKKGGHEIAGITCNKNRYMYNGWFQSTNDGGKLRRKIPCSLIKHDWLKNKSKSFCIDTKKCGMIDEKHTNDDYCFSYGKGPRTFVYIRKDLLEQQEPIQEVEEKRNKTQKPLKECTSLQMRNPDTKRCVSLTGAVAKRLLARPKSPIGLPQKECGPLKVYNPASKRCIDKFGVLAKKLHLV